MMRTRLNETLIHEAGHALMANLLGREIRTICINPDDVSYVEVDCSGLLRTDMDARLIFSAGAAAEKVMFGEIVSSVAALEGDLDVGQWQHWRDFEADVALAALRMDRFALIEKAEEIRNLCVVA